jgi:cell division protein FtsW (lipid II flippase)
MKKNITLAIVTLALAGLCCAISLITVRAAAPALLTSHLLAWAVGVVLLAVVVALGPARLSLVGLMIALCVLCLCLCCFIEESDYGFHQALVMFGQEMLAPAFFLSPSLILLYAWARRTHRGTLFYAVATITALLLAAGMPRLSEATLILFLAAALYGLVIRIQQHRTIRCLIAAAIAFSPLVVREVQMQLSGRSWFGPGSLIGRYTEFSWYMVANAPWIRTAEHARTLSPIGRISGNPLGFASYYCGNWSLVVLAVALTLLAVCLVIVSRRARTSTQKILAIGGTVALITQTALGILRFFFLIPRHASYVPFVSSGTCSTVACFALLGLVLASLRKDSAATGKVERSHRMDIYVCSAILVAIATTGGVLLLHKESLPQTKIARRMPENVPGFSFDTKNGALTNDLAYVPVKMATGFGEPSIVVALAAFWNGEQVWKEKISREPPVVTARCRIRPDGRLALDCRDLYEDEFTLVFDPPTNSAPTSKSSALGERWKISLDPQGHLGCTNLWTNARVSQAISKNLNLDHGFVSTAISRTDSRYIKLKITSDPDEIAYAKRNKRYCRLVIEKEPTTNHQ